MHEEQGQKKEQRLRIGSNIEAVRIGAVSRRKFVDTAIVLVDLYGLEAYLEALLVGELGECKGEADDDSVELGDVKTI